MLYPGLYEFVREFKADARFGGAGAYTYLGTVNYVKHEGSRPMNITWKLDRPRLRRVQGRMGVPGRQNRAG